MLVQVTHARRDHSLPLAYSSSENPAFLVPFAGSSVRRSGLPLGLFSVFFCPHNDRPALPRFFYDTIAENNLISPALSSALPRISRIFLCYITCLYESYRKYMISYDEVGWLPVGKTDASTTNTYTEHSSGTCNAYKGSCAQRW